MAVPNSTPLATVATGTGGVDFVASLAVGLPDPMLVIDQDATIVWGNPAAEHCFGLSLADVQGRSGIEFVHPQDLDTVILSIASVQEKRTGTLIEVRILSQQGWRLMEVRGAPLETPFSGHTVLVLRDITDRRRWELAADETAKFRSLIHNGAAITMLLDRAGRIEATSAALGRVLGIDQSVVENSQLTDLVIEDDRPLITDMLATMAAESDSNPDINAVAAKAPAATELNALQPRSGPLSHKLEVRLRTHDDGSLPVVLSVVNLLADPTVEGLVVSAHDISDRVTAEAALQRSNSLLTATFEATGDGILVLDIDGTVRHWNERLMEMWSLPENLFEGGTATGFEGFIRAQVDDPDAVIARSTEHRLAADVIIRDVVRLRDGRTFERDSRPQRVDGEIVGRVWTFHDVTQEVELRDQLERQAFTDALTGLANQALFRDRVSHALERLRRSCSAAAVLFIDLDDFKTINDSLGHATGDLVLAAIGPRLVDAVRGVDTVARLGGDEFAVLLEEVDEPESVPALAARILETIRAPVTAGEHTLTCSASIGIAFGDTETQVDDLLRNADLAMNRAKASGKDVHQVYEVGMHAAAMARLEAESNLRRAIREQELVLHYQPIWDLATGEIEAFEALVRWQHPEHGLLGPDRFIPFAEESGLIELIGDAVLSMGCRQLQRWGETFGAAVPRLSVNVAPRQLLDRNLAGRIQSEIRRRGIAPDRLILEVTESALMRDPEVAQESLETLRNLGVHLAVDDFGTGYSSLLYLQRFPIDFLKVDKAFVDDVAASPEVSLAGAILQLAATLGLTAVAEGIETADQLAALTSLGCELGQGYFLARPLTVEGATALLETTLSAGSELAGVQQGAHRTAVNLSA
jgi:diguanylate cyclase (GGDEF)-like protein/PAS domain S-box-containing protein